jgi:hypothetical protein
MESMRYCLAVLDEKAQLLKNADKKRKIRKFPLLRASIPLTDRFIVLLLLKYFKYFLNKYFQNLF